MFYGLFDEENYQPEPPPERTPFNWRWIMSALLLTSMLWAFGKGVGILNVSWWVVLSPMAPISLVAIGWAALTLVLYLTLNKRDKS
jgi:hypothetical protein